MCDNGSGLRAWETIHHQQIVNASPWLQLWVETVQPPDGRIVDDYYVIEQPDYVVVTAITDAVQVLTEWRYKHGPRRVNLGLPTGYVKPGESPLEAAQPKFREETGYEAASWQHLGSFMVDGNRGCGQAHCCLAYQLRRVASSPRTLRRDEK